MLNIVVNGEARQVPANYSLSELISELGYALDGLAVAVNDAIVPKSNFASFMLQEHMRVDVFSLVAGG